MRGLPGSPSLVCTGTTLSPECHICFGANREASHPRASPSTLPPRVPHLRAALSAAVAHRAAARICCVVPCARATCDYTTDNARHPSARLCRARRSRTKTRPSHSFSARSKSTRPMGRRGTFSAAAISPNKSTPPPIPAHSLLSRLMCASGATRRHGAVWGGPVPVASGE